MNLIEDRLREALRSQDWQITPRPDAPEFVTSQLRRARRRRHVTVATVSCLLVGALLGGLMLYISHTTPPGSSLEHRASRNGGPVHGTINLWFGTFSAPPEGDHPKLSALAALQAGNRAAHPSHRITRVPAGGRYHYGILRGRPPIGAIPHPVLAWGFSVGPPACSEGTTRSARPSPDGLNGCTEWDFFNANNGKQILSTARLGQVRQTQRHAHAAS